MKARATARTLAADREGTRTEHEPLHRLPLGHLRGRARRERRALAEALFRRSRLFAHRAAPARRRPDAAAGAPAGGAAELAARRTGCRARTARPRALRRGRVGARAGSRRGGGRPGPQDARQRGHLRRVVRLGERRALPPRPEPDPPLPQHGRRLCAPPGFLQPGCRADADAAHRRLDGRAERLAHLVGRDGGAHQAVRHLRRRTGEEFRDHQRRRRRAPHPARPARDGRGRNLPAAAS